MNEHEELGRLPGRQPGHEPAVTPSGATDPPTPQPEEFLGGAALPVVRQAPGGVAQNTDQATMRAGERASALATAHRHAVGARDTILGVQEEVARAARTLKDLQWSQERLQTGAVWPDQVIVNEQLDELARRCERSTAPIIGENLRRVRGALDAADVLTQHPNSPSSPQDAGDRQEMATRIGAVRELLDRAEPVLDRTVERLHHTAVMARYAQEHRRDGAGPVPAMGRILGDITTDGARLQHNVTDLSARSADAAAYAHTLARTAQARPGGPRDVTPPPSQRPARGRGMPR